MSKDTPESLGFTKPDHPKQERLTLEQRQARMLQAQANGYRNDETVHEAIYRLFKITPNYHRKDWRELIQYLKEAGDPVGKLEAFGKWWYKEDWRGKQGQSPTADQIRTYLPQAIEKYGIATGDKTRGWGRVSENDT